MIAENIMKLKRQFPSRDLAGSTDTSMDSIFSKYS